MLQVNLSGCSIAVTFRHIGAVFTGAGWDEAHDAVVFVLGIFFIRAVTISAMAGVVVTYLDPRERKTKPYTPTRTRRTEVIRILPNFFSRAVVGRGTKRFFLWVKGKLLPRIQDLENVRRTTSICTAYTSI
ncbi:hypothetical protein [Corynebacterium sp. A21]|uniref:hypothetical protein n=1 Tax=Corynebacterium sp. A21 TaxID=3457318 RepID=UPI003FD1684A